MLAELQANILAVVLHLCLVGCLHTKQLIRFVLTNPPCPCQALPVLPSHCSASGGFDGKVEKSTEGGGCPKPPLPFIWGCPEGGGALGPQNLGTKGSFIAMMVAWGKLPVKGVGAPRASP